VAGQACCNITSIDAATGTVTAKVIATGKTFDFKVTNQALLQSLKLGQAVYANFTTHQVSLDGKTSCCPITGIGTVPVSNSTGAQAGVLSSTTTQTKQRVTPEDERLVKDAKTRDKIVARIPKKLSHDDRAMVEQLVDQSLSAVRAGDGATAESTIRKIRSIFGHGGLGLSPWGSCGDFCQHLLDEGNPTGYGVCYWACVLRGGPSSHIHAQ